MKIVFFGSGEFGIHCLNALAASRHNMPFIVTQPPRRAGRGKKPRPTPVACWAKDHSIPFIETDNVNAQQSFEKITAYQLDVIVVIAFGQKVSNQLIQLPAKAAINVHASLLPKYRGAAPINWAIINGEKKTGITIIALAEKMDSGDILAQKETDIKSDETAGELHDRLSAIASPLLLETIDKIADSSIVYTKQDHSKATLAPKLRKPDGFLDFSESAESLVRKVLGFCPWPGASAVYISKKKDKTLRVTIAKAQVTEAVNTAGLSPGTLDEDLNVICGQGALKILRFCRFRQWLANTTR
jgi:methionyl-tRNA formyltransferase